jgi:polar amino acid transport system substrate-binding protein
MPDSAITCKADLTGKKISVQTGTTAEKFCMGEGYEVLAFTANNDAASALTTGKVDAWVVDNEVAVVLAAEQGLVVLDEAMTVEPYAFAFPKGSDTLVAKFSEIVNKLIADGTIQGIFDKYGVLYVSPAA